MSVFSTPSPFARKGLGLFWLLACFLTWVGPAWPQTAETNFVPSLSASVEKNSVKVGELIWVTLTYTIPENAKLPDSGIVGGLEPLTVIEQKTAPNEIKFRFLVDQLASFDLGPFSLTYVDHQQKEQRLTATPIAVTVLSNLSQKPEDAVLKPIEDIIATQSRWLTYLLGTLTAILLLGLVLGFFWWRKKGPIRDMLTHQKDPPHVRAEKALDDLVASGLFENGDVKTFYFLFSETIRRYLESIRPFPAAEMTTEEIARWIKADPTDQVILPLLRQADLVKFADSLPAPDRKDQDVLTARAYIWQTRPITNNTREHPSVEEVRQ